MAGAAKRIYTLTGIIHSDRKNPEPLRPLERFCERNVYRDDWRKFLVHKNSERIAKLLEEPSFPHSMYHHDIVESIFSMCLALEQPPEVRYMALAMFDSNIAIHFAKSWPLHEGSNTWGSEQCMLRILGCIQIAAKYHSNVISGPMLRQTIKRKILDQINLGHLDGQMINAERDAYVTLNFTLPTYTPLSYVEMFLEDLPKCFVPQGLEPLHIACVHLLDMTFAHFEEIFNKLFYIVHSKWSQSKKDKIQFVSVQGDYMYIAAGVLHAAIELMDPARGTQQARNDINDFFLTVTDYSFGEIDILSGLIREHALIGDDRESMDEEEF